MNQHSITASPRRRRWVASLIATACAIAVGAAAMQAYAAPDPGITCSANKKKAAIKRYDAELKCHITAMQKGRAVDATCLAKAEAKFDAAFLKAESKNGCATVGDKAGIAGLIDGQLAALNAALPSVNPFVCDVGSAGEADCNTCLNCSLEQGKPCSDERSTCEAEPDCLAFWDYITPCTDEACIQSCAVSHNYGAQLYGAMLTCAVGSCPVTCSY